MKIKDFEKQYGKLPSIDVNYYEDDDGNVAIDEDGVREQLEQIMRNVRSK